MICGHFKSVHIKDQVTDPLFSQSAEVMNQAADLTCLETLTVKCTDMIYMMTFGTGIRLPCSEKLLWHEIEFTKKLISCILTYVSCRVIF